MAVVTIDDQRTTVYMVMDASQDDVRRYWTGHGWTTDPLMGIQSQESDGAGGYYWELYCAGCSVALVLVELSYTPERTTAHKILILESIRYAAD